MKSFDNLDRDFDRALERVDLKRAPIKDPYGLDPLASDHLLLRKGWAYFHERIKMVEEQWERIARAKDEQIKILDQEREQLKAQLSDVGEHQKSDDTVKEMVRDLHLGEYVDIKKKTDGMVLQHEEERHRLAERIVMLESQLKNVQDHINKRNAAFALREAEFLKQLKSIEMKNSDVLEKTLAGQHATLEIIKAKDDELKGLYEKIKLLESDVEQKDRHRKEIYDEKELVIEKNKIAEGQIRRRDDDLLSRDREIIHLKMQLEIKDKEILGLRSDMARQQAEWRELWARSKEFFR